MVVPTPAAAPGIAGNTGPLSFGTLRRLACDRVVAVAVDDDLAVCQAYQDAGFTVLRATWMSDQPSLFEAQENDGRT